MAIVVETLATEFFYFGITFEVLYEIAAIHHLFGLVVAIEASKTYAVFGKRGVLFLDMHIRIGDPPEHFQYVEHLTTGIRRE